MANPYPEFLPPDEASGIEIEKPTHKAYQRGYEDGLNDGLERERQCREYQREAVADRAIEREMQLHNAYIEGQNDLTQRFSEFIDERLIVLEAIPAMSDGIKIKIEELTWAKITLARLAREKK